MNAVYESLGQYIALRRKALHLTQEELSERLANLGVARKSNTIANWETGQYPVPRELFEPLAKALEEPSAATMYELAGVLAELPGGEIVKMLDGLPQEEIDHVERVVRAMLQKNQ